MLRAATFTIIFGVQLAIANAVIGFELTVLMGIPMLMFYRMAEEARGVKS